MPCEMGGRSPPHSVWSVPGGWRSEGRPGRRAGPPSLREAGLAGHGARRAALLHSLLRYTLKSNNSKSHRTTLVGVPEWNVAHSFLYRMSCVWAWFEHFLIFYRFLKQTRSKLAKIDKFNSNQVLCKRTVVELDKISNLKQLRWKSDDYYQSYRFLKFLPKTWKNSKNRL